MPLISSPGLAISARFALERLLLRNAPLAPRFTRRGSPLGRWLDGYLNTLRRQGLPDDYVERARLRMMTAGDRYLIDEDRQAAKRDLATQVARIARTDATGAANYLTWADIAAEGVAKQWVTRRDRLVRESHVAVDSEIVDGDAVFLVDGFPMQYPGDPTAPFPLTVNCRCVVIAVGVGKPRRR